MKKKLVMSVLSLGAVFTLASCGNSKPVEKSFKIKVVDIDGKKLEEKEFSTESYDTVYKALETMNVKAYDSADYGKTITSISGSVVDSNYYVAIYENNAYASTGVDGLVIDDKDVFEFKVECWNTKASGYGTMDETDLLVDQAIYHYAKDVLPGKMMAATTYTGSTYWENMAVYMMQKYGYDSNVFQGYASVAYKASLVLSDDMKGAAYGKYYYAARLFDKTKVDAFKAKYQEYLPSETTYSEYSTPFVTSFAKELGVDAQIAAEVKTTDYRASLDWGTDGRAWQLTNLAIYNNLEESELSVFTKEALDTAYSKDTSLALYCLPYAAMNKDIRTLKMTEDKDAIQYLMDTFYDKTTYQFDTEKLGENDYSSNQIYASLMAYKVQRDQKKAVNLFA